MFILEVCSALERKNIAYAIVGGYAVALHGAVRGTIDVDIAVQWTLTNLEKAEEALKELGLVSRIPVSSQDIFYFRDEYIEKKNLIAWNFYSPSNPSNQVDIIINYNLKKSSSELIQTFGGKLRVLSRKALIEMKKKSGRPQDLEDIKALENL